MSSYFFSLYSLVCMLLPCIIWRLLLRLHSSRPFRSTAVQRIWIVLFLLYLWQVFDVTGIGTLADMMNKPEGALNTSLLQGTINLVPFRHLNLSFVLNIVLCAPLGFLLPLLWRGYRKLGYTALAGFLLSAAIECSQLLNTRTTDVDDLIANTLGAVVGYLIWKLFCRVAGERLEAAKPGRSEAALYMLLSFLGTFFLYNWWWFSRQFG